MKIRQGFVSNSSSSSFICSICNGHHYIMDGDPREDGGLAVCENDHAFCVDHILKDSKKTPLEYILESAEKKDEYKYLVPKLKDIKGYYFGYFIDNNAESRNIIDHFELNHDDKQKQMDLCSDLMFLEFDFLNEIPFELCPFCNFKIITNWDITAWLNFDLESKSEIISNIKNNFKTYEEFQDFLTKRRRNEN